MQCLILAGGFGTRISTVSAGLPKSLIPVLGKPFLHYQLSWLKSQGIKSVVLALGYKAQMIIDYVGDGKQWGLDVTFIDDGDKPLGTAGAIREAIDQNLMKDAFFVLYGDSYLDIDLTAVWTKYQKTHTPLLSVFKNDGLWDASNVLMKDGEIILFEKNHPDRDELGMNYIDYGISIVTKAAILEHVPSGEKADLADVFHHLSLNGHLSAFEATQRFYEIGSPEGLADLEIHLNATDKPNA